MVITIELRDVGKINDLLTKIVLVEDTTILY